VGARQKNDLEPARLSNGLCCWRLPPVGYANASSRLWHHFFGLSPLDRVDLTPDIHPDYACRMPLARPHEMARDCPHLGLPADLTDPIAYVARSGGYRQTDRLDVFPEVKPDRDGCYRFFFGLGNFNLQVDSRLLTEIVRSPDRLEFCGQIAIDRQTGIALGSLPGYITEIIAQHPEHVRLQIERANDSFFTRQKLLCSATCPGFRPFATDSYLPIGNLDASS
jgi:hypothetical protein